MRTSKTHPLQIAKIKLGAIPDSSVKRGTIGMTICPGKKGKSLSGDAWNRDLGTDLKLIKEEGFTVVLTLMEWHEMRSYQVPHLGIETKKLDMKWVHFPILDGGIPPSEWFTAWKGLSVKLQKEMNHFGGILIHCLGGLGRTGTIAGMMLQDMGVSPEKSIEITRAHRPGAIENSLQENFLLNYPNWSPAE